MKPRVGLLEFGLALLVGWGGWAVWTGARQAASRHEIFSTPATPPSAVQVPAEPLPRAVRPTAYSAISSKNLFSAKRGSLPRSTSRQAGQVPADPLPVLSGIANLGDGPAALLAAQAGARARWVGAGEQVGGYRLEAIQGDRLTFSFRGQRVIASAKDLQDESRWRAGRPRAAGPRPVGRIPTSASALGGARPSRARYRIGAEFRPGRFAADATDGAPDGTVYEGYVRRVRQSPFGAQHWWEKQE
ncbi:MAG: hypothetical protein OXB91_02960 [Bryobacterales bacterium]|nr:hypothetical protein [Bryobacterales bacterium]